MDSHINTDLRVSKQSVANPGLQLLLRLQLAPLQPSLFNVSPIDLGPTVH